MNYLRGSDTVSRLKKNQIPLLGEKCKQNKFQAELKMGRYITDISLELMTVLAEDDLPVDTVRWEEMTAEILEK